MSLGSNVLAHFPGLSVELNLSHDTRNIARAASVVMAAFVLANLVGLARQVIINRTFGTSAELDSYFAAFRVPDLIFNVIAGGALGSAFIPVFTGKLANEDKTGAWRLASSITNWVLIVLTTLALLAAVWAPWLTERFLAPGFGEQQVEFTASLMRIMLISTIVFGVSGVVMGIHHSHQHFLAPALAPAFYNIGIIVGASVLAPYWGVHGLAYGVVIGSLMHLGVQLPRLIGYKGHYYSTLDVHNMEVLEVWRLMLPRVLGLAVWQINFWVNTFIASKLPSGSISALVIAFQIFTFPQAVIGQAVATAAFPTFSTQAALRDINALRNTVASSLRGVLYFSMPATLGLILLGHPLIAALFQNRTFTVQSTEMVSWALSWYALGLVSHSIVEVTTRAFFALKDTRTPVAIGIIAMMVNVALSVVLSAAFARFAWAPHGGLALANTVATTMEMVAMLWMLRARLDGLAIRRIAASVVRTGIGVMGMWAVLWVWLMIAPDSVAIISLVGIPLGLGTFWGITLLVGSQEANRLPDLVLTRIGMYWRSSRSPLSSFQPPPHQPSDYDSE